MTDPVRREKEFDSPFGHYYTVSEIRYEAKRTGGDPTEPPTEFFIADDGEFMIPEDSDPNIRRNAGTFAETELSKDTFDRYFPADGKSAAAGLRRNNVRAWQMIGSDLSGSVFYDLLLQKDGGVCLTYGYWDAAEKEDPYSDDTCIFRVFLLKEITIHSEGEADKETLRAKYPGDFVPGTFKGLEVCVRQMAPDSWSCGLMPGTNRNRTPEDPMDPKGASGAEMRAILSAYDIDENDIFLIPRQNPFSSYVGEYRAGQEEEDPAAANRRKEFVGRIRELLSADKRGGG